MLCFNVCKCGTVGHDVCETIGVSVTVYTARLRRRSHRFSFGKLPVQCDARNEACRGVLGPHVVVHVLSDVFRGRST